MTALTVLSFALRGAHECCHWLTARAAGVAARVGISRRLYILVFETDLTWLWALPRSKRYWPLLSGMAFDTILLAGVLTARAMTGPPGPVDRFLAALAPPTHPAFWEAAAYGLLLLSPQLLTLRVALRDLTHRAPRGSS